MKLCGKKQLLFLQFNSSFLTFLSASERNKETRRLADLYLFYLFVNSAELGVLVEQQQLLLIAGGDSHALGNQSDLLLCGQQPVTRRTDILCPACTHTLSAHASEKMH